MTATTDRRTRDRAPSWFPADRLGDLIERLHSDGYRVIGPTVRDGAVMFEEIASAEDLPVGVGMAASPGRYRIDRRPSGRRFDHVVGPSSAKRWTFPPRVPLRTFRRTDDGIEIDPADPAIDPARDTRPLAFVGMRACEIAALAIQDRVLLGGPAVDPDYRARREGSLVIAVECATSASTCFCTSMGTGPEVTHGFDLALSELDAGFVVRAGSAVGEGIVDALGLEEADLAELEGARTQVAATRASMGPPLDMSVVPAALTSVPEHPGWDAVAERCLSCANCTLVCPTCFCTSVTQRSDLAGETSVAERTWDACFTDGFARVAGGSFRPRVKDRYRQWLTHKFATWWDQFGSSGCVGCGRCIAWCPVGIDVREELRAIAGAAPVVATPETTGVAAATPETTDVAAEPAATPVRIGVGVPLPVVGRELAEEYVVARVVSSTRETADTVTLRLATADERLLAGRPGQFVMATLPAFSAAPISVSRFRPDGLELTIRGAGPATRALTSLERGAALALRGPLGRGWPVDRVRGHDVVIVAGGIGLAPLRGLVDAILADRDAVGDVRIFLGARTPRDRLFVAEMSGLAARRDIELVETVDRAGADWFGRVGIVTQLFDRATWDASDAIGFVCGPERMMQATADVLADRGLTPDRTWVTLERNMSCGVGLCGHCQLGSFFVCRDGPVFSLAELGPAFTTEGL